MLRPMTGFARVVLWIGAAAFFAIGAWLLINPEGMAQMGLPLGAPVWRIEIRAFYGGLEVGLAIYLAICALRPAWCLPGLTAAALVLGGAGSGRLLGMLADGMDRNMLIAMASELGGAALAVAALLKERKAARRSG
jgi:hypothetical protein